VGEKEKEEVKEDVKMDTDDYVTSHNPYLYDSKGPKRQIDYSKPEGYDDLDD
jgi:hypothetical protein